VPDTWDNLYSFFINRVRDRLHVVLCFSPVGKKFSRWAQQVRGWVGRSASSWWGASRHVAGVGLLSMFCMFGCLHRRLPGAEPRTWLCTLPFTLSPPPACPQLPHPARCPQFPGLINGCTIDWYLPWPEEALTAVSSKFLGSFPLECSTPGVKTALQHMMASVHVQVTEACQVGWG
jgi:hypothetical protein